jgi:hypothetical protein
MKPVIAKKKKQVKSCQVFVKTLTGRTVTLEIFRCEDIRVIKEKIQAKEGS